MNHHLHQRALGLAREFKHVEAELMSVLREIDEKKFFRKMGYGSLFEYATKGLGLTESVAYGFITVARKSKEVPELKSAIEQGVLSVSQAKRVTSVMDCKNAGALIEKAKTPSQRELERTVAELKPETAVRERARFVTADRLELKLGVSEEVMKRLKRVQDLVSQKTRTSAKFEDALVEALECYLEKNDPVRKARRASTRKAGSTESVAKPYSRKAPNAATFELWGTPRTRRKLTAKVLHEVNARDRGRCTHVHENGERCESERWLEVHHVKPLGQGGGNAPENLLTLCSSHHKSLHG